MVSDVSNARLEQFLTSHGFERLSSQGPHRAYRHGPTDTVIVLPPGGSGAMARATEIAEVHRMLIDRGIATEEEFNSLGNGVACGSCGQDLSELPPEPRVPCPRCGSTSRKFYRHATTSVQASATATATVVRYHRQLLDKARQVASAGEGDIAVIVAQTACEVCTERAFDVLFRKRGAEWIRDSIFSSSSSYNLISPRVQKPYTALSGDKIQTAPFWNDYKDHVDRRNKVVHKARGVGSHEATASIEAATKLIEHLERVVPELGS